MTYAETVNWLFLQLPNFEKQGATGYKPGLTTTLELLKLTGNPEKGLRFLHVAGTNGKGSVCNMLASVMIANKYKTGLFTSPHLHDFRERIRIDGQLISEEFVVDFVAKYKIAWEKLNPTFFEITTVMAIKAFADNGCDVCILETGMGGRLDSTNVVLPELSIITNIGLDHTTFLGDTLEKIAREKAGIIKENIPVVIGEMRNETRPVFESTAQEKSAVLIPANLAHSFKTDLAGKFQVKNIATVVAALEQLKKMGWTLEDDFIQHGLSTVKSTTNFSGRFQKIADEPITIVDAGHNADGIKMFLSEIETYDYSYLHLVYGAANDKDLRTIFNLFPKTATYYFAEFDSKRTTKLSVFRSLAEEFELNANYFSSPQEALFFAKKNATSADLIGVVGSFYLIEKIL